MERSGRRRGDSADPDEGEASLLWSAQPGLNTPPPAPDLHTRVPVERAA